MFDRFENRSKLLANVDNMVQAAKESKPPKDQGNLFGDAEVGEATVDLVEPEEIVGNEQLLFWEKEMLGVYVSGHPLNLFTKDGLSIGEVKRKSGNEKVFFTAMISSMKPYRTKQGERMFFVTLEDEQSNQVEGVIFPGTASTFKEQLRQNYPVSVKAETSIRNDEVTVVIHGVELAAKA